MNLQDNNPTNLVKTIELNALKPLVESGLILSYEKSNAGLHGIKFIIKKERKTRSNEQENPNAKTWLSLPIPRVRKTYTEGA